MDQKRKKLDEKSIKCVHLGMRKETKSYRMYNPVTKRIIVSRDVVFDEQESWKWRNCLGAEPTDNILKWDDEQGETELSRGADEVAAEVNGRTDGAGDSHETETGDSLENDEMSPPVTAELPEQVEEINEEMYGNNVDRTQGRVSRAPGWMRDHVSGEGLSDSEEDQNLVMYTETGDPKTYEEAAGSPIWKKAMVEEIQAIEKNKTWFLSELPSQTKAIGVKWIYKTKLNERGEVDKHKARLVVLGYAQKYGIDYTEVFAPVARWDTIRLIMALAAHQNWDIYQLDVKSAFLHGELKENVYIEQPKGFVKKGEEGKVLKLKKALYGLKQAPRAWYSRIKAYFLESGFEKCPSEHTLFTKTEEGKALVVSIYVDDLIFTGNDEKLIKEFKVSMKNEFDMTDLGKMKFFLGVEVVQNSKGIYMSQRKYALEILQRFGMEHSNPTKSPIVPGCKLTKDEGGAKVDPTKYKQMIGCLMYLTVSRPDLMYVMGLVSRYMEKPTELHMMAVKRVLRYLRGTTELGICYQKKGRSDGLIAYSDSDYAGDLDDRRSTSGYVFMMSSGAVAWSSKKQAIVTLSTTEAEFISAAACACQAIWMQRVLKQLRWNQESCVIYCDNSSTIKLSKNPVMHGRSKHIVVRYHFLRDLSKDGDIELKYCSSQEQVADIMTKPLKLDTFVNLRNQLGVCDIPKN